ncbi:C4-dicarboxylate transporter DcuC [Trueperella pecoris]|uniref:C4-dicarboxylate transporter DcuC n=1 Tax=Trueperella pecoris TaxID=2733571 RepID=UPI00186B9299|nr:C4-dicarboxylate transporter DcuC [Trueperella pecoris]QOQ39108.1 C4-dicarboxylate transporter DcuC [Trueperella pecoris]
MLGLTIVFPNTGVVRPEKWPDTGKALLDVFDHVRFLFSTTGAELGLIIMAAGLAMLLMVTVYPLLIGMGISRLSAAAVIATVKMPVATAMLISAMVGVIAEMFRHRSFRQAGEVFKVFFEGMGRQFTNIVTLIIAAQMLAAGLTQLGFIETIINASKGANFGAIPITIVLTLIILLAAVVTGSGKAPWFAVSSLAPEVAQSVGVRPVFMAQPMELASGIGRSMSPVAGVVIAVAGLAGVNDGHRQAYGARHGRRLYHDDRLLDGMGLHRLHDSPLTEERTS